MADIGGREICVDLPAAATDQPLCRFTRATRGPAEGSVRSPICSLTSHMVCSVFVGRPKLAASFFSTLPRKVNGRA
jgi:hypothetical protein